MTEGKRIAQKIAEASKVQQLIPEQVAALIDRELAEQNQAVDELLRAAEALEVCEGQSHLCPRCRVGVDDNKDGNCGICAQWSDAKAESYRTRHVVRLRAAAARLRKMRGE